MADPVVAYIDYLQAMARKIAYRGAIVDVLGGKSKKTPDRYLSYDSTPEEGFFQQYLAGVVVDRQAQEGRTLFLGHGLVAGPTSAGGKSIRISAPLLMTPCEVDEPDEIDASYTCEPDWAATTLNYDVITALLDQSDTVDVDGAIGLPNQLSPAVTTAMDHIERRVREAATGRGAAQRLTDRAFVEAIANTIRSEIPAFRGRITDKANFRREDLRRADAVLSWYNHRFYFMAQMPDSLSAYRALEQLGDQLQTKHGGTSETLRRLLTGVLTGSPMGFRTEDPQVSEKVRRCQPLIPLPLSGCQQQAVINAYCSDISYVQGPPGTGKSHTIAATMLMALLLEKRVLLTSHKKAAIDVVRAKLKSLLGSTKGDTDIAIYVGPDPAERSKMRSRINDLISHVQSWSYEKMVASAAKQEDRAREELQSTLRQIIRLRKTLTGALAAANDTFRASVDHQRARATYHDSFGEGDLSPEALSGLGEVDGDWEVVFEALGDAQAKRASGNVVSVGEALRTRLALRRYSDRFGASWIASDPWNAHRLQAHYAAIEAHHRARTHEGRITADLNQIRRNLAGLETMALEQAKTHLRTVWSN